MVSADSVPPAPGPSFNDLVPNYDSIRRLPIDGLNVVEVDGKTIYTSTNGRFIFTEATMYDSFNRKYLRTPAEIAEYATKINLDAMGLDRSMIGSIELGSGDKNVTMFVDPQCGYCSAMLAQVLDQKELWKIFTFHVVGIPLLGEESGQILKNLVCANRNGRSTNEEIVRMMADKDYSSLVDYSAPCDEGDVERAIITAKLLGAKGVPFVIGADGTYMNSMPRDIAKFLGQGGA